MPSGSECNVFSAVLYQAWPSSLVFFAECLKIFTDSDLQIKNYKIEVLRGTSTDFRIT